MSPWLFAFFILIVWCLWGAVAITGRAVEQARQGIPEGQRGGTSLLPVIPLFPIAFWSIAWLIDRVANPWGTRVVGVAHVVFAALLAFTIVRDSWRLRSLNAAAGQDP